MEMEGAIILVGIVAFLAGAALRALFAPQRQQPVIVVQSEPVAQPGGSGCLLFVLAIAGILLFLLFSASAG
jgi:hypothetical protein